MNLTNCCAGDMVEIRCDSGTNNPSVNGTCTIWCHVAHYQDNLVVIGWLSKEPRPRDGTWEPLMCHIVDDDAMKMISGFEACKWIGLDTEVLSRKTADDALPPKSSGLHCAGPCHEFNHYAVANQPDGVTFVCFSCRSTSWKWVK